MSETTDNTKVPEEDTLRAAGDAPKSPAEDAVVANFVKSAEAAQKIVDVLPENTAKQKFFKAVLWAIVSLSATLAVPCGSLAFSYGQEKAKVESRTQKKKAEAENTRRKLQLDLLKQIIEVAKKAEFKDPKSVYRLGLIAAMVNENHSAFGIRLIDAEKTMKDMSDRLAPIAGLRRRLAESGILLADLQERYKDSKKEESSLKKRIKELSTTLKTTKYLGAWRKKKLQKELNEKENELDYHKAQRRFYQERLVSEQKIRLYFSDELKRQEKSLKDALQETETLRDDLKKKTAEVTKLATKLEKESSNAKKTAEKFKAALQDMQRDHSKAEQNLKRLKSELDSERQANDALKKLLKLYSTKLEVCTLKKVKAITKPKKEKSTTRPESKAPKRSKPAGAVRRQSIPTVRRAPMTIRAKAMPMRTYFLRRRALDGLYKKRN